MKVIDLYNKMAKEEKVPRKFTYKGYLWEYDVKNKMWFYYFGESKSHRFDRLFYMNMILNDEVEILEEENKFTKEDFIKEAMDLEGLTREEFNKIYEVKECNCGREFCKGFIKVEKVEEKKKIPEKIKIEHDGHTYNNFYIVNQNGSKCYLTKHSKMIAETLNQVIDYLNKGDE